MLLREGVTDTTGRDAGSLKLGETVGDRARLGEEGKGRYGSIVQAASALQRNQLIVYEAATHRTQYTRAVYTH